MAKISIEQAGQKLLEYISPERIGDKLYDMVQMMYFEAIREVERDNVIEEDETLPSWLAWYDDLREGFFEKAYDKTIEVLSKKL